MSTKSSVRGIEIEINGDKFLDIGDTPLWEHLFMTQRCGPS